MAKTFEDWKQEYYPVPAGAVTREEAAAHSLRKWEGLRPEVLREHGLYVRNAVLRYGEHQTLLSIDAFSCALCVHHALQIDGDGCRSCPLFQVLGNRTCDGQEEEEYPNTAPYSIFANTDDPEPMIAALRLAVEKSKS